MYAIIEEERLLYLRNNLSRPETPHRAYDNRREASTNILHPECRSKPRKALVLAFALSWRYPTRLSVRVDDGIALKKLCYKLYDSAYLHYNRLYTAQLGNSKTCFDEIGTQEKTTETYDIAAIKFKGTNAVTNFDISRYVVKKICSSSTLTNLKSSQFINLLEQFLEKDEGHLTSSSSKLLDFKKLLDIEFEKVKASSSSSPQNHPLIHQFRQVVWKVNRGNIEEISQADMFLLTHKHKNGELDEESMRILMVEVNVPQLLLEE
ncbi:Uncharacterized protein TCM_007891 [Theobroma cacao]|uniref:Uncharacterized protein n=1 Tax=Theobroma cacao TaxID=3641 RepID=A0A061EAI5_THECC|nr:Uncharacterized protein TCM_007891 [Theobroma cacao]